MTLQEKLYQATEKVKESGLFLKELMEKSNGKHGEMPADDQVKFDNAEKAYNEAVDAKIALEKEIALNESLRKADDYLNFKVSAKSEGEVVNFKAAIGKYIAGISLSDAERKSLTIGSDPRGGYLAPEQLMNEVIQLVRDRNWTRAMSRVYTVRGAATIGIPVISANMSDPVPTSEIATSGTNDTELTFGIRNLTPRLREVSMPIGRLLEVSSAVDIYTIVFEQMAYVKARKEEKEFLTGNGANEAMGVFTESAQGVSSSRTQLLATATAIAGDDVINAVALLREQFRTPNLRWVFHRNLEGRLRKLKDTNNNYIFSPIGVGVYNAQFLAAGMPGVLTGIPYYITEYITDPGISGSLAASTNLAMLGDWSQGYAIADSIDGEIVNLDQKFYPQKGLGLVAAYDGQPINEQAFVRLRTSA
jgi:HK97 family phage major capsid protein